MYPFAFQGKPENLKKKKKNTFEQMNIYIALK